MNDLISREAAIDVVEGGLELIRRVLDNMDVEIGERGKFAYGLGLLESCIEELSELPSAQPEDRCSECDAWNKYKNYEYSQWIPVMEKSPEIGQIVLCSLKTPHYYGQIHVCKYCAADKYHDHPYFDWGHNGFPNVVAWMPLPECYKGES